MKESLPLPTFYPAVLFSALIGGAGAGVFAAILGGLIGWWAFMPPHFAFFPVTFGQQIGLLMYFSASLLMVWGADHYRKITKRLEDEEKFRKLAVDELAHRLKNKLATIQSIISFQLRDDPQIRDAILSRLTALSATDDLIMETQGQGARLRGILSAELRLAQSGHRLVHCTCLLLGVKRTWRTSDCAAGVDFKSERPGYLQIDDRLEFDGFRMCNDGWGAALALLMPKPPGCSLRVILKRRMASH